MFGGTAAIGVTLADMKALNMKWAHDESQGNAMTEGADQQSRLGGGTHNGGNRAPYDSALIAPAGVEEIVRAQQLAALRNELERQLANANLAAHQAAVTLGAIRCDREAPDVPDIANLIDDVQRDLTEASSLVARWRW